MRYYTKILFWENNRRLKKLIEFRNLVIEYFNNSQANWGMDPRIEKAPARAARVQINRVRDQIHDIILHSGINPTLAHAPPPAIGGYVMPVDVIQNIFFLDRFQIEANVILDFIERSIGVYESNHKSAIARTFNPFFYLGLLFDTISELPFIAIGKLGFNRRKMEESAIGRLFKGVLYLITVVAAFLTILQLLDLLGPVKQFVHELLGSNNAN